MTHTHRTQADAAQLVPKRGDIDWNSALHKSVVPAVKKAVKKVGNSRKRVESALGR
jgi:hypothetical protein